MLWPKRYPNRRLRLVAGFLLAIISLELIHNISPEGFITGLIETAEAAQVTIDATASTAQLEHIMLGSQSVFISDQIGYKFYTDSVGICVYSKTINAG